MANRLAIEHPLFGSPSLEQIQAEAARQKCSIDQAALSIINRINKIKKDERENPLQLGWEPQMWKLARVLLGLPCYDKSFLKKLKSRLDMDWQQFSKAMLTHLKFEHPVKILTIEGGNRSGKSQCSAKIAGEELAYRDPGDEANVYFAHMNGKRSIQEQQPLTYQHFPPEYQIQTKTAGAYISYKQKTGFSDGSFILPNTARGVFLSYEMDRDSCLEGIEPTSIHCDELLPPDWFETMLLRIATRDGFILISFTPVHGYSPLVKIFHDGAEVVKEGLAYLIPEDGGEPDEARALNLSPAEYEEIRSAQRNEQPSRAPQSRDTDIIAWLEGGTGQVAPPPGRKFASVPRVLKCADPDQAVLLFHSNDNPYGNPKVVIDRVRLKSKDFKLERFYGYAKKTQAALFPKFNRGVHTLDPDLIPGDGTNYMLIDPASDRNFFLSWFRRGIDAHYLYREWPGSYPIPGIGYPGNWAKPSGRKAGLNDGDRDEAQEPFGFGLLRYKFEIARLERWENYLRWRHDHPDFETIPDMDLVYDWDDRDGAEEPAETRYIDARASTTPRVEKDRPSTLRDEFDEIGLYCELTPGNDIMDGVARINTALDYERGEKIGYLNSPSFFISTECNNSIFAMEVWMFKDGQKGSTKDPIDNMRYYFDLDLEYVPRRREERRGRAPRERGPRFRHRRAVVGVSR